MKHIWRVSIHAPRAGRDCDGNAGGEGQSVSIHAPRAGRDLYSTSLFHRVHGFNPRAPCGARRVICFGRSFCISFNPRAPCGARPLTSPVSGSTSVFQSTRPVRGATRRRLERFLRQPFQSTRPVRGATRTARHCHGWRGFQSTRPVRGATILEYKSGMEELFQSTRPVRGATGQAPSF